MTFSMLHSTLRRCCHFSSKFYGCTYNISSRNSVNHGRHERGVLLTYSFQPYSVSDSTTSINLKNESLARYVRKVEEEYYGNLVDRNVDLTLVTDRSKLEKIISLVKTFREIEKNIVMLKELKGDCNAEEELKSVEEELAVNEKELIEIEGELVETLLPVEEDEKCSEIVIEIMPGVGGQESMLFAKDLFNLYCNYLKFTGWNFEIIEAEESDLGGMKNATLIVTGNYSFKYLRFEGGVHQVQRVPKTERGGRMHTSTASVAVYPRPSEVDVSIDDSDLEWEAKTSRGPGGQHVNKIQSAVRLTHLPTGIVVECQVSRSHTENRKEAYRKLCLKLFKLESDKHTSSIQATRKAQIKNKSRNEKARTYNFPQNRITDHRFKKTIHNIPRFFEGEEYFHDFLEEITESYHAGRMQKFLESLKNGQ